jgi:hypothetical protein
MRMKKTIVRLATFISRWIGAARKPLSLAVLLLACNVPISLAQQSAAQPSGSPQPPIRIEITQPAERPSSSEKWISLIEKITWPVVVVLGVFVFRKPLSNFLDVIGKRATEISIGSLGIKLPTMSEAQLGEDVLTFRAADTFMVISSSAKSSLFRMFEEPGKYEFVAINLGRGEMWLSSRLYIFATMLQRMKSLRCIVILGAGADTESQFIGATTPDKIRWGLAMIQPWLEVAYAQAYAQVSQQLAASGLPPVTNENGGMVADTAEQLVKGFITNLTINPPAPLTFDWVTFALNQPPEHATWLSREYLEPSLGYILWRDTIVASETKKEAKSLLRCSAPYVAKVKKNGEFLSLIDRVAFLDEVMGKIGDKLETKD